jgi:hypothetical protein
MSALLAGTAKLSLGDRVLLLHIDDPALARWAVECVYPRGQVIALHSSYRALALLARVPGLVLSEEAYPDPAAHGPADVALLSIPKGREHVQAYLWTAAQTLRSGGRLYLAGANASGAKSAIKDAAALFGEAPVLGFKSSHRIALATRPDTLAVPAGWAADRPWETQTRTLTRPDGDYTVITQPGVFSALPAELSAMYDAAFWARSESAVVTVSTTLTETAGLNAPGSPTTSETDKVEQP